MKRFARTLLAVAWFPSVALASSFQVTDIRLEGLQRLSAGRVFASLPINIGDTIDTYALRAAADSLFSTGDFDDVRFEEDNGVLVVHVIERPAIESIEIEGEKAISEEDLLSGLNDSGLAEGQIFRRSILEGISTELERQYMSQGRYNASVEAIVTELPRNRVAIKLEIDEGSAASVEHINIVGNTLFTDEELLEGFEMQTAHWLLFWTDDSYSREKLSGDIETLRSHYLDRGYLDFDITSSQVSISDDYESIFITLVVEEGEPYTIGETRILGEMVVSEEEMSRLNLLQEGMTFSQILMTTSSDYMTRRLSNEGYTFAEVQGVTEKKEDGTVDVTYMMQPGERTYVRRIEFRGNTKTADEVLRREMRQMEGSSASNVLIDQGKVRLERLGFFSTVEVETTEVPGVEDQVDVTYTVEETASGSVGGSIGYSAYGFIAQANLQQNNFLGTGNAFGINMSTSRYYDSASISFTDPYFTPDGVSRGFTLFYNVRDFSELRGATPYGIDRYGAELSFGWPISEIERISMAFSYTHSEISPGPYPYQQIKSSPFLYDEYDYYYASEGDVQNNGGSYVDGVYVDDPTDCYSEGTTESGFSYEYFSCAVGDTNDLPDTAFTNNPPGFIDEFGDTYDDVSMRVSWMQSTLNRGILPNRGYRQNLSLTANIPSSDLTYWKIDYNFQYFQPLFWDFTLKLRGRLGYGNGYGELDELPFFENFYAGGQGSVRGYYRNVLGPRSEGFQSYQQAGLSLDAQDPTRERVAITDDQGNLIVQDSSYYQRAFGGNLLVTAGAEIIIPTPFIDDSAMVQTSLFFDAGNVFSTSCENGEFNCGGFDGKKLFMSAGINLTWISTFGPLTFSWGKPFNYSQDVRDVAEQGGADFLEYFQFSMGQTF